MDKKIIKLVVLITILLLGIGTAIFSILKNTNKYITYREFNILLEKGNIETVFIGENKLEFKKKESSVIYETENPEGGRIPALDPLAGKAVHACYGPWPALLWTGRQRTILLGMFWCDPYLLHYQWF